MAFPNNSRVDLKDIAGDQLPEFVRSNYPTFVLFVEAYYEWMDNNEVDLLKVRDIDTTLDDYIQYFKKELAHNYPIVSSNSDSDRFLLKHIKEQYLAKGSEISYKLLFRLIYGKDVFIDYPGKQMLRISDGRWQQDMSIFVQIHQGTADEIIGKTATVQTSQKVYNTEYVSGAGTAADTVKITIENAIETSVEGVFELFVNRNFFGEVIPGDSIKYGDNFSGLIVPCTSKVNILSPGEGFSPGQVFQISSGEGTPLWFKVAEIQGSGGLKKIDLIKFGLNYKTDFAATILPTSAVSTRVKKIDRGVVTTSSSKITGLVVDGSIVTTGSNYTIPPVVNVTGDGFGADVDSIINDGVVSQINITDGGSGYLLPPVVVITGTGTAGTAHTTIDENGSVTDVIITSHGFGYTSTPTLTFDNAPGDTIGSGALGTVTLVDGGVTGFIVNDRGAGYKTAFFQITNAVGDTTGFGSSADAVIGSDYDYSFIDDLSGFTENGYLNWGDYWDDQFSDGAYVGTIARQFFINSTDTIDGVPALLDISLDALARYPGYYKTNDGFLNDSMFIQDSYYYQAFAYVLKIDEQLESYASVTRSMLHPSGMAMFGEYSINNVVDASVALQSYVKSLGVSFYDIIKILDNELYVHSIIKDLSSVTTPIDNVEQLLFSKYLEETTTITHTDADLSRLLGKFFGHYDDVANQSVSTTEEVTHSFNKSYEDVFYIGYSALYPSGEEVTHVFDKDVLDTPILTEEHSLEVNLNTLDENINTSLWVEAGYIVLEPYDQGGYFAEVYANGRESEWP